VQIWEELNEKRKEDRLFHCLGFQCGLEMRRIRRLCAIIEVDKSDFIMKTSVKNGRIEGVGLKNK
jgi:hypothetical protein